MVRSTLPTLVLAALMLSPATLAMRPVLDEVPSLPQAPETDLVADLLASAAPAGPLQGRTLRVTPEGGAPLEFELPEGAAKVPGSTLLQLPVAAGRKVEAKLLDVEALARSGRLAADGTVPVIVRAEPTADLPGLLLPRPLSALGLVAGRVAVGDLAGLALHPAVERVYLDDVAQTFDLESYGVIRAYEAQNRTDAAGNPVLGTGVVIAILDTGIDYGHPELGGCLGAGCKVAGGYDHANADADPMDDNGHGTHVADTAAGLHGIAPGATLLAHKVCNAWGGCAYSWILAGIENATLEGADVISMSLGGPGTTDGVLAQAVEWAVAQGVVVVSAAGNSGCYDCIGEPAAAPSGIAVGATTKWDGIAWFSSRGPVYDSTGAIAGIKPDVVAPGVDIVAAVPATGCELCDPSGYRALSGTSMATPHVSGVAALLLDAHPAWSPDDVKGALMGSATHLGAAIDARTQGAGRIDALAAVDAVLSVLPGNAFLGVDAASAEHWTKEQPLRVKNLGAATLNVTLDGDLRAPLAGPSAPGAPNPSAPAARAALVDASVGAADPSQNVTAGGPLVATIPYDLTLTGMGSVSGSPFELVDPYGNLACCARWPYPNPAGGWNVTFAYADLATPGVWSVREQGDGLRVDFAVHEGRDISSGPEPGALVLAPGESADVVLTVTVPNAELEDGWREGSVTATPSAGGAAVARVSFVKSGLLHLDLDPRTWFVLLERDGAYADTLYYPGGSVDVLARSGTYHAQAVVIGCPDVAPSCDFGSISYALAGPVTLEREASLDARLPAVMHASDAVLRFPDGTALDPATTWYCNWRGSATGCVQSGGILVGHAAHQNWFLVWAGDPVSTQYFPTTDWRVSRYLQFERGQETFVIADGQDGVDADVTLDAAPGAYRELGVQHRPPAGSAVAESVHYCVVQLPGAEIGTGTGRPILEPRDVWQYAIADLGRVPGGGWELPATPCESMQTALGIAATPRSCTWEGGCEPYGSTFRLFPKADGGIEQRAISWSPPYPDAGTRPDGDVRLLDGAPTFHGYVYGSQRSMDVWRGSWDYNAYFTPGAGGTQTLGQGWGSALSYEVTLDGERLAGGPVDGRMPSAAWDRDGVVTFTMTLDRTFLEGAEGTSTYAASWNTTTWGGYLPALRYLRAFEGGSFGTRFADADALEAVFEVDFRNAFEAQDVCVSHRNLDTGATGDACGLVAVDGAYRAPLADLGPGAYALTATFRTSNGATITQTQSPAFTVGEPAPPANRLPGARFTSPEHGATLSGVATLAGVAGDPDGDAEVLGTQVSLDGGATWANASGVLNWTFTLDTTTMPDGHVTALARARDAEGYGSADARNFTVFNNDAPTVAILSPGDGEVVSGIVAVHGRASDADADGRLLVEVSTDGGASWSRADGGALWTYEWDARGHPAGPATLLARAFDGFAYSETDDVLVQVAAPEGNHAPTVAIASPETGATVRGTLLVTGSAADEDGAEDVQSVRYRVDGGGWSQAAGTTSWAFDLDTTRLANGVHEVEVVALDAAAASAPATVWFVVDNEVTDGAPSVRIHTPRSGDTVSGILAVRGAATDPEGVVRAVEVRVDEGPWQPASGAANWSFGLDTRALPNGVHRVQARASDGAQWSDADTVWFVVENAAPDRAPTTRIERPADGATVAGLFVVAGTAEDDLGVRAVRVSVDGGRSWKNVTPTGNQSAYWRLVVDSTTLPNGETDVLARAWDGVTWGEPDVVTVTVANRPPPQADLVVAALEVVERPVTAAGLAAPGGASASRLVRVTVENAGEGAANASVLRVLVRAEGDGQEETLLAALDVPALAPGARRTFEVAWGPGARLGDHVVRALADADEGVAESDEANNEARTRTSILVGGLGGFGA